MRVRLEDVCCKASSNLRQKDIDEISGEFPVYGASGPVGKMDSYHQENAYVAVVKDGAGIGRTTLLPGKTSVIGTMQYLLPKDNVLPQYLYYVVMHMHLEKYFTGATIPHIYFKDYKGEEFNLSNITEQYEIVEILGRVEAIIQKRKDELAGLDILIKARFVEMFGDPVNNPMEWEKIKLDDLCKSIVRGPFGSSLKKEFFVEKDKTTYKVYEQKHAINKDSNIGSYYITAQKYNELKRFDCQPGDFLMSCSGTMGELYQLPNGCERGIINQALCKFTLNEKMLPIVFLESMKANIQNLESKGSGIKNIAAVSYIREMKLNLPPMKLQEAFAAFVSEVDKSKAVVQKALDETQLLFDSLMQEYFG